MKNKHEIDLNTVPHEGMLLELSSTEIEEISLFEKIIKKDSKNTLKIKVIPIEGGHFEVKVSLNLKRPLDCSRCGEPFEEWFKKDLSEYLSLNVDEEGEGQGFILVESPKWDWPEFIRESIELETPYQTYKYGEQCLKSCLHYDNALEKGWISEGPVKASPFKGLEKLKNKLN